MRKDWSVNFKFVKKYIFIFDPSMSEREREGLSSEREIKRIQGAIKKMPLRGYY